MKMAKVGENESKANPRANIQPNYQTKVSSPEFCELIGKREAINIELSKREGDLRRRLEMLECWMPAVTIMKMMKSGFRKPDEIGKVIDKQTAGMTISCLCPSGKLSQHEDIRIREIEGKRKKAARRLEEAKRLLTEKQTAVEEQSKKIDEARRRREGLEEKIKELEAKISCANGLDRHASVQSVTSIGPDELMYLTKLEELVKSEETSRKQLEELEKRQEMYIKALETAGDIWRKEEHHQEVDGLKSQLEIKSSANQQLADRICQLEDQVESLKSKLTSCNEQLTQFTDRKSVEVMLGTDITYRDIELSVRPDFKEVSIIYDDSEFTDDKGVNATPGMESRETSTLVEITERAIQDSVISIREQEDVETNTEHQLQFVSLPGSDFNIEDTPASVLIYDSSVPEVAARSRSVKFDVSTQTTIDCICIEITELQMLAKMVNKIRLFILKCDTCKMVKPEVDVVQEAISRLLGIEFVENDEESGYALPADRDTLAESVDEYQVPTEGMEVTKIDKERVEPAESLIERGQPGKGQSSELFFAGGIDGVSGTVDTSTPQGSMAFPVAMSTPITQKMKKISSERIFKDKNDKIEKIGMIPEEKEDELTLPIADATSFVPVNLDGGGFYGIASDNLIEKEVASGMKSLQSHQRSQGGSARSAALTPGRSEKNITEIDDREMNEIEERELRVVYDDEEGARQDIIRKDDSQAKGISDEKEINEDNKVEEIGEAEREGEEERVTASEIREAEKASDEDEKKKEIQKREDEISEREETSAGEIHVKEISSGDEIEAKEIKQSEGEEKKIDENGGSVGNGSVFTGGGTAAVAVASKSTVGTDRPSRGSSKIQGSLDRLPQEMTSGDVLCTVGGDSQGKHEDLRSKCPVTSRMSVCICHALRRWPRMTRREYEESKEAITKIPAVQKPRRSLDSKTVSSATVDTVERQTQRVEKISEMPSVISDKEKSRKKVPQENKKEEDEEGDMCDPCECDPCASVSTTSSEAESIQPVAVVEKKDQAVMAKIYKPKR